MKKYLLRAITFSNVADGLAMSVRSRELMNKSFVIVSAMTVGASLEAMDVTKFDGVRMGFADPYLLYKKLSLLSLVGGGGDSSSLQLWMFQDLTEFEIPSGYIYLDSALINPDTDYPIVHILEAQN